MYIGGIFCSIIYIDMKKLLLVSLIFSLSPVFTFAQEKINSFDVSVFINPDSTIEVEEKIIYDFGSEQRHGIFRDIPVKYKARGGNYNLDIYDISARDERGDYYETKITSEGSNKRVRIGSESLYVAGEKVYIVSYAIGRAINYFDTHDELYWNITGNDWPVEIQSASAKIYLPQGVNSEKVRFDCFRGSLGSSEACVIEGEIRNEFGPAGQSVEFVYFEDIDIVPYQGITAVVSLPKGVLYEPSFFEKVLAVMRDNLVFVLPILVFSALFVIWYDTGRDPRGRGAIVAQFGAPSGLTPSEVGTIIDEKADRYDVSADIIQLAVLGYIKIIRTERSFWVMKDTDYILQKLRDGSDIRKLHQKKLFDKLFEKSKTQSIKGEEFEGVRLSDLKHKFDKDFKSIKDSIYNNLLEENYFSKNPEKIRNIYRIAGVVFLVLGAPILVLVMSSAFAGISVSISGLMIFLFGYIMPKKTRKGVRALEHILGLKKYLEVAEKERIKFHNAPEKDPKTFEKLLPYAMVLKVEKQWAKQFEEIYNQEPSWYSGPYGSHFSAIVFTRQLDHFNMTANHSLSSSASSGGSGFSGGGSGGGFGGGGGGSW